MPKRPYAPRQPIGIDILKRGAGYLWRVRSRNKMTIYRQGREVVRMKAQAAAEEARRQVVEGLGL